MKQHYMNKFKAFIDKRNDTFINGLKVYLEGVTIITSSEDGEDGYDDRDLGGNAVSRHVTRGVETSKLSASRKTQMIRNLEEHVFRIKEAMKDIVDFVKEGRLIRVEKEKQKKKKENKGVQIQSQHSSVRAVRDDSDIKKCSLR